MRMIIIYKGGGGIGLTGNKRSITTNLREGMGIYVL